MTRIFNQEILDSYKQQLKGIVDDMISSSINFKVSCKTDIDQGFIDNPGAKGLYIWYVTCNPSLIIKKWNDRLTLYEQYKTKNANSLNPIKTSSGKPIDFLLPKINPQCKRNQAYTINDEAEVILYVGKAQGENELGQANRLQAQEKLVESLCIDHDDLEFILKRLERTCLIKEVGGTYYDYTGGRYSITKTLLRLMDYLGNHPFASYIL